jgi:hypothetical protein
MLQMCSAVITVNGTPHNTMAKMLSWILVTDASEDDSALWNSCHVSDK